MMNSSVPITDDGLPSSLKYELPPSIPESTISKIATVFPTGINSVTGSSSLSTVFVANSAMANVNFGNTQILFDLPAGHRNDFVSCADTNLTFKLTWTVTTAGTAAGGLLNLISSAASFIEQIRILHNNAPIEVIAGYNLIHNLLLNSTVNQSERYGSWSMSGCDTNSYTGIDLPFGNTGTYYFNFSIPLICILGLNCMEKLFPIGLCQNLQVELTTATYVPVASYCTALTTQAVIAAPVLSDFALNLKYINLGDIAGKMVLDNTMQNGKILIKSQTYNFSNVTVPVGSYGLNQLVFQIRNYSVRSVFLTFASPSSATSPNGYYDAFNPAVTALNVVVGGTTRIPIRPLNPSQRPSECHINLISAFGGLGLKSFSGTIYRGAYGSTLPALPSNADNLLVVPAAGLRNASNSDTTPDIIVKYPSMHFLGFDLDRVGPGILFSGTSCRNAPVFVEATFGVASTQTISASMWALCDMILQIDVETKQITSFF